MKKLTVWAMLAMLVVAGSAFAATGREIAANATFDDGGPATTNNDDSCDIGVAPAATLLLPYFEVDLDDPAGETTLFTITNVSNLDADRARHALDRLLVPGHRLQHLPDRL